MVQQGFVLQFEKNGRALQEVSVPFGSVIALTAATDVQSTLRHIFSAANPITGMTTLYDLGAYREDGQEKFSISLKASAFFANISGFLKFSDNSSDTVVFPADSLGGQLNLETYLIPDFVREALPFCPVCGKQLDKEFSLKKDNRNGVALAAFDLSDIISQGVELRDCCEMYGLNYLMLDGCLYGREEVLSRNASAGQAEKISGVPVTAALPRERERFEQDLKNLFKQGFERLDIYFLKDRHGRAELIKSISDRPYCDDCQRYIDKPLSEKFYSSAATAELFSSWKLNGKTLSDIQKMRVGEFAGWCDTYKTHSALQHLNLILKKTGFEDVPLMKPAAQLSFAERFRLIQAMLLISDLHDCVFMFEPFLDFFTSEEKEKYLNVVRDIAANDNICILTDSLETSGSFCDKELVINDEEFLLKDLKQKKPAKRQDFKNKILKKEDLPDNLFPGKLIAVCGESASGKTSLMRELLNLPDIKCEAPCFESESASNLVTALGLRDAVAGFFADSLAARLAGLQKKDFFLNGSRYCCGVCQGSGIIEHLSENTLSPCQACSGRGFLSPVTECLIKSCSIADVYRKTVGAAAEYFSDIPSVFSCLKTAASLGLGNICLNAPLTALSYRERRLLSLLKSLSKRRGKKVSTLFILDDMLMGLKEQDLQFLHEPLAAGDSVIFSSNCEELLARADYVVDLSCHHKEKIHETEKQ